MTALTLLFDEENPCWDHESLALAGEDPEGLEELLRLGLAEGIGGTGAILTEKGMEERARLAVDMGIPVAPYRAKDPSRSLWRTKVQHLIDRAFLGRWGLKEFSVGEPLPVVPYLQGEDLYRLDGDSFRFGWEENPLVRSFCDRFNRWGVAAREFPAPGDPQLMEWIKETGCPTGSVEVDVLLRSGYDFDHYRTMETRPTDRFKLQNADRLFCFKPGSTEEVLTQIGHIHLFMLGQRRVYIPGWSDFDSADQENWTMILLIADDERELDDLQARLAPWEKPLIEPANPLFILGTSLEKLREVKEPKETIYDWFCDDLRHIARPDR